MSVKKVTDIKLDIEKSVKREGTFDIVRKQGFAIANSDGFLESLQKKVAVDIRNMVRCNPERLSKEDFRRMIRHHLRTKYMPEITEKVNSSVDREWLKSQLADNVKEKVEKALMVESVMEGKVPINSFDFGPFASSEDSGRDSSSGMTESGNSCSDMSVSDVESEMSFVDVMN
ncbi:hypothetical protein V3C99_001954 [Haemonchus contortus]|uniref:ATP-cone domain-containing protein n=2 Tax=Haemonchus TaxID=6288 RepID=A0A0N4WGT9_HAEPC|nr:unnamed protein product [Haemonchus contortus]VDO39060.1 unnamed protein product [Haemonchus placei]